MNYTVEELIQEAKQIKTKIITEPSIDIDEIEKLASSLEKYISKDYYKEAEEKAVESTKKDMEKIAAFCSDAVKSGYTEEQILDFLEKNAAGLVPMITKGVGAVIKAPFQVASRVAFGSKSARQAEQIAAATNKRIGRGGEILKNKWMQRYVSGQTVKGLPVNQNVVRGFDQRARELSRKQLLASQKPGKPIISSGLGASRKLTKPALMVGGGAALGATGLYAANQVSGPLQPPISYGQSTGF